MAKKKILLLVPMLDQGGLERMCALTARLLQDICEVTVVVFHGEGKFYDTGTAEVIDLHLGSRPGKLAKVWNVLLRMRAVRKIKKAKEIDTAYSFGNTANLVNVLSKRSEKVLIGIRAYGALQEKKLLSFCVRGADKIVCCTQTMREEVQELFPNKQVVNLYNPCDLDEIQRLQGEERVWEAFFTRRGPIVATMSRVHDVKGFWHMLKAFSYVVKEVPNAGFVFVGAGDFTEYKNLAKDLGIADYVFFAGLQKNPYSYLNKASAYVLTSESEGFPNALIEALAVGLPALAVNCKTGPSEILMENHLLAENPNQVYDGDYGILLPVMNPKKNLDASILESEERIFAEELGKLLKNPDKLAFYQKQAKKRAAHFSTERYLCELVKNL